MPTSAESALRGAGLRVTKPRLAVLDLLHERPHASADDVWRHVHSRLGGVSVQAVYDVLAAGVAAGLVRRIDLPGSPARFEARTGDNHHHLVCESCGRIVDVDCAVGSQPCLTPSDDAGYDVHEADVVFRGRCSDCRT